MIKKIHVLSDRTKITTYLAYLRESANLTQQAFANKHGVTQSTISKLENGDDLDVKLRHLHMYAAATKRGISLCIDGTIYQFLKQ